jgi:hypothetical protein
MKKHKVSNEPGEYAPKQDRVVKKRKKNPNKFSIDSEKLNKFKKFK